MSDAKAYLEELLNNERFRIKPSESRYVPFTSSSIDHLLYHIGRLSVRKINEVFSLVLELAQLHDAAEINEEFINSIKSEIVYWQV